MDFRPFENTLEALYNPKFMNHSSVNMGLLEPHSDQQAAMGKLFQTNSRQYRYGRTAVAITNPGASLSMSLITFDCVNPSSIAPYNCQSIRKMKAGDYGIFVMLLAGGGGGGGEGTDDYNMLSNKPIWNLSTVEVSEPYTQVPSTIFSVGDTARVLTSKVQGSDTVPVELTFLYCYIDPTTRPAGWTAPVMFQKCFIGNTSSAGTQTPFGNTIYYTSGWLAADSTNNLYDARILRDIPGNIKFYGWVWLSMYQGNIDMTVTPPSTILPPPGDLRRKNGKKS